MLSFEQLETLRKFDSPTICNALERFNVRPRNVGFMSPQIKSVLTYEKSFIGYASTAKVSAAALAAKTPSLEEYYKVIQKTPRPAIAVIEDIDPVPVGSFWGEVNAHVHMALGCVAAVTNGGVRDLKEVRAMNFGYFASCVLVSHAYIHLEDFNCPVNVGGMTINPGDLLFCDQHGVITIPEEVAPLMIDACHKIAAAELPVIQNCKKALLEGKEVDIAELMKWRAEMNRLREAP